MKGLFISTIVFMFFASSAFCMGEEDSKKTNKVGTDSVYIEANLSAFQKFIHDYNRDRANTRKMVSSLRSKKDQEYFNKILTRYQINKLPPIKSLQDKAYISIGDNLIVFSILSIRKGQLLINDRLVSFDGSGLNIKFKKYQKELTSKRKFSFLSLLISEAYAVGPSSKLDKLLVATVMKVTKGLEDGGFCVLCEEENTAQLKKNFDKVIGKMDSMANECESLGLIKYVDESEIGRFAHSLNEIQEYKKNLSDDDKLNEILEEKFKLLETNEYKENMTCGQLAYLANKEEVHSKFKQLSNRSANVFASYIGSTSAGVKDDGKAFEKYISQKCEAHSRLMNCLATNSDYGRAVYNRDAGRNEYKRVKAGQDISEDYQVQGISK